MPVKPPSMQMQNAASIISTKQNTASESDEASSAASEKATQAQEQRAFQNQQRKFVSFDGSTTILARETAPESYGFFKAKLHETPSISRGAGLSYAAASFGTEVCSIDHKYFNRILAFNKEERWIEVEAGITLGQLYDFLIEHGLFLATQPGHPSITVGGSVAADIHGKNQYLDGTCINQVISLKLFHPAHGIIELSAAQNPQLFRLTCGAYGLTGSIISCKLRLKSVESTEALVSLRPLSSIEQLVPALKVSASSADFLFSWHDFNASGSDFGKGFIQEGRFRKSEQNTAAPTRKSGKQTLSSETRAALKFPVFNPLSVRMMNILYGERGKSGAEFSLSLFDSIFPIQNSKELYFKFFGAAGFHEYQVVIPESNFLRYIAGVKQYLAQNPLPITLASAKLFSGKQDLLRFTGDGICFALNFAREPAAEAFLAYLDKLVIECAGVPNIIKDSRLSLQVVSSCYPEYDLFRQQLHDFDPKRIYRSELSERLGL